MQLTLKIALLVLTATLLTRASIGQVDPCDPGGAKFGTKDCPEEKTDRKSMKMRKMIAPRESAPAKAASPSRPRLSSASPAAAASTSAKASSASSATAASTSAKASSTSTATAASRSAKSSASTTAAMPKPKSSPAAKKASATKDAAPAKKD